MKPSSMLSRLLCPAVLVLACVAPSASSALPASPVTAAPAAATQGEGAMAAKGETRLRKLHLVRPDLIPYPIAFEIYC